MAAVPEEEHIHFSKLDLADGFWRMIVEREARWLSSQGCQSSQSDERSIT
jgi:hypothetical protein